MKTVILWSLTGFAAIGLVSAITVLGGAETASATIALGDDNGTYRGPPPGGMGPPLPDGQRPDGPPSETLRFSYDGG